MHFIRGVEQHFLYLDWLSLLGFLSLGRKTSREEIVSIFSILSGTVSSRSKQEGGIVLCFSYSLWNSLPLSVLAT